MVFRLFQKHLESTKIQDLGFRIYEPRSCPHFLNADFNRLLNQQNKCFRNNGALSHFDSVMIFRKTCYLTFLTSNSLPSNNCEHCINLLTAATLNNFSKKFFPLKLFNTIKQSYRYFILYKFYVIFSSKQEKRVIFSKSVSMYINVLFIHMHV